MTVECLKNALALIENYFAGRFLPMSARLGRRFTPPRSKTSRMMWPRRL